MEATPLYDAILQTQLHIALRVAIQAERGARTALARAQQSYSHTHPNLLQARARLVETVKDTNKAISAIEENDNV